MKALDPGELAEGRVKTVTLGTESICMTHHEGRYGALDNRCPHQGGPLGEGSIEGGLLRCPWHGWDFCPHSGKPPGGYDDGVPTHPIEVRDDGVWVAVPDERPHVDTVSDVMIRTMANWGVRWCLGMVGHSNLNVADAIRRLEERGEMRFIGIRHEGAASFACSAYGKLTGRPAACLAIAGPGATNLLTGLWDANVDRSPVVALTGQVGSQVLGRHNFQEVDLKAAFGGVATWSAEVLDGSPHAELMNQAVKHAIVDRGPTQLIFPDEIAGHEAATPAAPGGPDGRVASVSIAPDTAALDAAVDLLRVARRPVIVVGHGARFDMDAVVALAESIGAPIMTTFKGKGLVPDDHPLACGVLGRSGTPVASWFMNECDAMLVLGASFSNHTGITPKKPLIQVDADRAIIGKFHPVAVPMWSSIDRAVSLLQGRLADGADDREDQAPQVAERHRVWREEKASRLRDDRGHGVSSIAVFDALARAVDEDAILAIDVGNNAYSFGRYFECRRQSVLMSGYLGSIGFALPAAMGAWCATQEDDPRFRGRQVVSISGDGGLGQYLAEISTLVHHRMNVTHVVLNNSELGKISKEQRAGHWPVWKTTLTNPSFAAYAELCGARGLRVERAEDVESGLAEALAHDGPALVEIVTDADLV